MKLIQEPVIHKHFLFTEEGKCEITACHLRSGVTYTVHDHGPKRIPFPLFNYWTEQIEREWKALGLSITYIGEFGSATTG